MAAKIQMAQQIGLPRRWQSQQTRDGQRFAAALGKVNVGQLRQQFGAFLQVFRRARQRRSRVRKVRRKGGKDVLTQMVAGVMRVRVAWVLHPAKMVRAGVSLNFGAAHAQ